MSEPVRHLGQVIAMTRWLLIGLFVVLGWIVLSYLAHVLAPILAAMGIAYLLNPMLDALVARGVSRTVGAGLLLLSFMTLIVVGIVLAIPAIVAQVSHFLDNLPALAQRAFEWIEETTGFDVPDDWQRYFASEEAKQALGSASGPLRDLAAAALDGVFSVLGILAEMLLVPVFAFYFLVDWPNLWKRLDHMVPPRRRANIRELARQINNVVSNWVRGQAIVTSILAVLYAICFTVVGMPLSVPIGLLVGALTVIPFVGTFVGAAIAGLVTLGGGASLQTLALVGIVIVVLHLLEAAVLTPKIVGHRVGLSESAALLAVVAGGKLLGFVGVVLAVPIAATFAVLVRAIVRYYESTAFFGRESDADVVVTPAMALVMPGTPWSWQLAGYTPSVEIELPTRTPGPEGTAQDEWLIAPELGPSGAPRASSTTSPPASTPAPTTPPATPPATTPPPGDPKPDKPD